jgi:hypothetical protein
MKALVTILAFGGAVAATALTVTIQQNPRGWTSTDRPIGAPPIEVPVQVVPVSMATNIDEPAAPAATNVVTIEEVKTPAPRARRWRPAAPAARAEPDLVVPKLLPAPCVQGEYRKLEEHRGVYLTCPGQTP